MNKIGGKIIDGLRDALKYAEGESRDNKEHRVLVDTRNVRRRLNMKQNLHSSSDSASTRA